MSDVVTTPDADREFDRIVSTDGWTLTVELAVDPTEVSGRGALLVPASKHERDGWGPAMVRDLLDRGFVVLSTDIRGRGASRHPRAMFSLPPGQLRRVHDDVVAAVDRLVDHDDVESGAVVLFGEQDTADLVASVAITDDRVGALVLVSPELSDRTIESLATGGSRARALPVCLLTCKDDGVGLLSSAELVRRSAHPSSRIRLVADVGSGTTMFAAWQYLRPDEPSLERWLGAWAASVV